jgi:8-oxo-dGTP pyrophosphatase MutT (NUDIX family)
MSETPPEPRPSATVVVVRDAAAGLELLLLGRAPGQGPPAWVFPGGRVEPGDVVADDPGSVASARHAAVRETREECGLVVDAGGLVVISRWITPAAAPKRFDTWFFLGEAAAPHDVCVDGAEIVAARWLAPAAALEAHHRKDLWLAPPTFVTVSWLSGFARVGAARAALGTDEPLVFRPRIRPVEGGMVMLYPGDAGYEAHDPSAAGARHRLWALASGYRYERG